MASVADQHCASCIGTLPFPIPRPVRDVLWGGYTEQSSQRLVAPTDRTVYTDMPLVSGHATATFTVAACIPALSAWTTSHHTSSKQHPATGATRLT